MRARRLTLVTWFYRPLNPLRAYLHQERSDRRGAALKP